MTIKHLTIYRTQEREIEDLKEVLKELISDKIGKRNYHNTNMTLMRETDGEILILMALLERGVAEDEVPDQTILEEVIQNETSGRTQGETLTPQRLMVVDQLLSLNLLKVKIHLNWNRKINKSRDRERIPNQN